MNDFRTLVRRFRSDERGAFLVIFAVIAIALVAMAGAVVDFTMVQQTRNRAQVALDAAVLALQPKIYSLSEDALRDSAQALLSEALASPGIGATVETARKNTTNGQLYLEARLVVPTAFVTLVGVHEMPARLVAEATRRRLNVEVAMVLDNSSSMNQQSRMSNLKQAANNAADILFSNEDSQPNVFVGVVPFTEFVNVGTTNRNASWIDQTGTSPLSRVNFDSDDNSATAFAGPVNRFDLYSRVGATWRGCVEARPSPHDVSDTPPDINSPETLFVASFAPDEPDTRDNRGRDVFGNNYLSDTGGTCVQPAGAGSCRWVETRTQCDRNGRCDGSTTVSATYTAPNGMTTTGADVCSCSATPSGSGRVTITGDSTSETGRGSNRTLTRTMSCTYSAAMADLPEREAQERLCKYQGATVSNNREGPNMDCPIAAVLPLTNQRQSVKGRITAMVANGYTNIHQGAIWGFHMLSPAAPLTEATPYDQATYKVMILMTDGENTHPSSDTINGSARYVAYGYPSNGRLDGSAKGSLTADMDQLTKDTCDNAKQQGITIFTIGLNPPNQSTRDMLTHCATSSDHDFFPDEPSELNDIFATIASQLSNLRLAQ
ncbi:Flp pilus assembly protein TadG [Devosia enhydra]|uniref:Flp pilus assembly protein TadG n=1 Tax=Devosia enhydra TaxID=665118 RepID=A0A1K2I1A8_9HYPH|nr:TadE/TadG family type IV pilus assembly protein [Devosia enhydra]SFZ86165.1 Flp pilus assembly protein TadG [Devosia enhydra]